MGLTPSGQCTSIPRRTRRAVQMRDLEARLRVDDGQQFIRMGGFGNKGISAGQVASQSVLNAVARSDHNDRELGDESPGNGAPG